MRISKIKFSGFKSFVDPTTLLLPSNLTGVVGPNGCGKSNIIDAVQWVLGESSAKHLRGDQMTDIIFNGSNTRKPVGQASIELIFDNADGAIGGKYAAYNEIAIKRVLSREGVSQYYLNGARCRRRDVTQLFLGTGVGSRSYSVIEQGMISRVIEAKPEELRYFLEEAAGISKYKERRRETENRIRHTRDNLNRLNDIREELEKQLNRLNRQAKAAERYKELKQEQRQTEAEQTALHWQQEHQRSEQQQSQVRECELGVEQVVAELRHIEAAIEQSRDEQTTASDAFNEVQGRYYSNGADISRLEQSLQHHRERLQGLENDLQRANSTLNESRQHLQTDQNKLEELQQELSSLEPRQQQLATEEQQAADNLQVVEQQLGEWQQQWNEISQQHAELRRQEHGDQTRLDNLVRSREGLTRRLESLQREEEGQQLEQLEQEAAGLRAQLESLQKQNQELHDAADQQQQHIDSLREQQQSHARGSNDIRGQLHGVRGRLSSLETLQQNALNPQQQTVRKWMADKGLQDTPRLAQKIRVDSGWERAVETVLSDQLEALCVAEDQDLAQSLAALSEGHASLISQAGASDWQPGEGLTPLQQHVQCDWPLQSLLAGIYVAADLDQALSLRARLQTGESLVTPAGIRVGGNWMRVGMRQAEQSGVIERESELQQLRQSESELSQKLRDSEQQEQGLRESLKQAESALGSVRSELRQAQENLRQTQSGLSGREGRLEQGRQRLARIAEERQSLQQQSGELESEYAGLQQQQQQQVDKRQQLEQKRSSLEQEKQEREQRTGEIRQLWKSAREAHYQAALRLESIRAQKESLQQSLQRHTGLVNDLGERSEALKQSLAKGREPLPELEQQLAEALQLRVTTEQELSAARTALSTLEQSLREHEQKRSSTEELLQKKRSALENARVEAREFQVRMQGLEERLGQGRFVLKELLEQLAAIEEETVSIAAWQEKLDALDRRITRLGPINLAAIDEFEQETERKRYLDEQFTDLSEALDTLENAMRKIDRETRSRFKETFDKVNSGMQSLFPKLFGGGHAQLDLTSDDLLETGVTVTARPPGKRNSSIHLLSGGEKALTAVAFVFAIFQLNPAPFCLLDEVDAPLDDANVGRLCDMIKQMSEQVQFVIITHNKITMEIVNQLVGVTMHEAGVSRLVAVDMNTAVDMVATG